MKPKKEIPLRLSGKKCTFVTDRLAFQTHIRNNN